MLLQRRALFLFSEIGSLSFILVAPHSHLITSSHPSASSVIIEDPAIHSSEQSFTHNIWRDIFLFANCFAGQHNKQGSRARRLLVMQWSNWIAYIRTSFSSSIRVGESQNKIVPTRFHDFFSLHFLPSLSIFLSSVVTFVYSSSATCVNCGLSSLE